MSGVTIGVLALQGAFAEHIKMLRQLGVTAREVRKPEELDGLDGLIIPGGESTSMALIAERWGLVQPLKAWVAAGKPTWGTCAGMILLSDRATGQKQGGQALIGGLDVTVNRNYFGRQIDSFEAELRVPALGDPPVHAVFIRAPAFTQTGPGVSVLADLTVGDKERVAVAVQAGPILATAFHPELTDDLRWHALFARMAAEAAAAGEQGAS
ncbi:MAG: pyridoxal 5'-phosphate synthase glutaminase subunit PdxT [Caldilineaceae bacterium]|nr:pyridoxal 5'-phosphate synthase glutaminase subunit PdxT [Caldilineaceae bacterium]